MESKKPTSVNKLKLNCSVRLKPCGSSQSGVDYNDNYLAVGKDQLGPFTSVIGPNEG